MSRVVVITGASEGIGETLARRLGARGDSVVLAARRAFTLNKVADEIGENALAVVADATKRADHEHLRDAALERFGHIDVWINNAGRGIGIKTLDLTEEQLDEMITVNLKSVWFGMMTIVPYFKEQGHGHLVNVSSVLGRVPTATMRSAYSAAKAAVNSLTANARMDLRAEYPNIHVSLVMPGPVSTGFHANAVGSATPYVASSNLIQTADQVAIAMEALLDNPVPEIYTNPGSASLVERYFANVAAYEDSLAAQARR